MPIGKGKHSLYNRFLWQKMETSNYKKFTQKRNPIQFFLTRNFLRTLARTVRVYNPQTILDVGCGEGFTLNYLQKHKIGKRLEGIEYSDDAITLGKKLYPSLTFKKGNIYKLPYKDNSFDLVVCTEVLEHLDNPRKAYKELIRVSKRFILLSVPNEPLFKLGNLMRGKDIRRLGNNVEHIQNWTALGFLKFVKTRGVKIVTRRFPIPWTMVLLKKA